MATSIYRVSCEYYDRAWLIRSRSQDAAIQTVKSMTEEMGWHLDKHEDDEIDWEAERVLSVVNQPIETQDI